MWLGLALSKEKGRPERRPFLRFNVIWLPGSTGWPHRPLTDRSRLLPAATSELATAARLLAAVARVALVAGRRRARRPRRDRVPNDRCQSRSPHNQLLHLQGSP